MATTFEFKGDEKEVLSSAFQCAEHMVSFSFVPTVSHQELRAKHVALIEAFQELQKCGYSDVYETTFTDLASAYIHGYPEMTDEELALT